MSWIACPAPDHLVALLNPGSVLFGATILGKGVGVGSLSLAHVFSRYYNAHGVFTNTDDSVEALTDLLAARLRTPEVRVVGSVAFFAGRT